MPRSSNIELLRVVVTMFVLILHCNGWLLNDFYKLTWESGDTAAQICRPLVQAVTVVAVNVFILISGFFSIKPKCKSIVNLFSVLFFFYVGTYLFACYMGSSTFAWKSLIRQMMAFSRENWFIQCYLFLVLLSPVLNSFVQISSKHTLRNYVLAYIGMMFYFSCVHNSTYFYFNRGYSVTCFVGLYLIGRYLKLYLVEDLRRFPVYMIWGGYLFITLAIALLYYFNQSLRWVHYASPLVILSAVLLFVIFERIQIQSKVVNWVGSSCLSVYIFHTCLPILPWLSKINYQLFSENPYGLYALKMLLLLSVFFFIVILLDKVRVALMRPILKKI